MDNYIVLLFAVATLSVSTGLEWISKDRFPSGDIVHACVGDTVRLTWEYQREGSEQFNDIEWFYQGEGLNSTSIATRIHGRFFVSPGLTQKVGQLPSDSPATIELQNVTTSYRGIYNVTVIVIADSSLVPHSQSVVLEVDEPPVLTGDQLKVSMLPAENNADGQLSVVLGCGVFTSRGQPPMNVTWMTPTNASVPSTGFRDGNFLLHLPAPAPTGNYSCHLQNSSGQTCFPADPSLTLSPPLMIGGFQTQLAMLSGRLEAVEKENEQLQTQLEEERNVTDALSQRFQQLQTELDEERNMTAILSQQLHNVTQRFGSLSRASQDDVYQPENCQDVYRYDTNSSVHTLFVGNASFSAFCDQFTDGGGWTVIQRRQDGSVNFFRNWTEYENGFGNASGEYWLGLANIHLMTSQGQYSLRVDLEDFDNSTAYATYNNFSVSGADDNYRLHVSGYNGTAGDSLATAGLGVADKQQFSTPDNDHTGGNCSSIYHAGWWFSGCMDANLNGLYQPVAGTTGGDGVRWYHWHNDDRSYKRAEMKIRRQNE